MTNVNLYLVGGAVRDHYRGERSKDWDFAVETGSFSELKLWLSENNFTVFAESPKYMTIRARAPQDAFKFGTLDLTGTTFDFSLCRTDGDYSDGRHPDTVEVGTIYEDLSRRDFTMNAIALDRAGRTLDPFGGVDDIWDMNIKCVGGIERLQEDGLRIMRAIRFAVQLLFILDDDIKSFLKSGEAVEALKLVSEDRIRQELAKALRIDSNNTLWHLEKYPKLRRYILNDTGIWLEPTSASK